MRAPPAPRAPALLLPLLLLLHCAVGAGVFELQVLEFSNPRASLASGACCGGVGEATTRCAAPCRTRFTLCLKEYQSAAAPGACSFGRAASPVLGTDSFTLPEPLYTLALPFSFRWTRSFTLILQAYDDHNYTEPESGLIEEAWWSGIVEPGAAWHALRHAGEVAAVAYRVRVSCQTNYYNATCTTFCRARDDKFGHYACAPTGEKRCLPGWQGDNCEIPVCKEGCHPAHGRCDRPGECECRPGWRGELCAQCQPYPGCKRGYCNGSSWDCTCDTNWGGILCDQDLNYCGTHEPCQHGGTCENTAPDQYLCTCAEGFSGVDCERVDNPCAPQPCAHGTCALASSPPGYTCTCDRGWGGPLCDEDLDDCASAPCRHGASCRDLLDAFACDCAPGWTGPTCDTDVDECAGEPALGPCVNAASCANTPGGYSCACLAGWTGHDCETNVDDCTGQCLNGATCIDLVNDFHCACAAGWAGRTCARDIDDCASRPCRNGGECVDRLDAYRCICPVGFTGVDCELSSCSGRYCVEDRDHCAGAPCENEAPCYTAQDDYYCHCAPGWTGKNCSLPDRGTVGVGGDCAAGPCRNNGSCVAGTCACRPGWTGDSCTSRVEEIGRCGELACGNGGTCVHDASGWRCACTTGWAGAACEVAACACGPGGACVAAPTSAPQRWACACREGWTGARCDQTLDGCTSTPCRNGARCMSGVDWWACECTSGWTGADCSAPLPLPPPTAEPAGCTPPCPPPATCTVDPALGSRCTCPAVPPYAARRCLELLSEGESTDEPRGGEWGEWGAACGGDNATWWWGCNACRCAGDAAARVQAPTCSRLWCGLPDCLAPQALPCRTDEVCVPAAPVLCLRAPCAPLGECRRVAGRRVEPPVLPAPPACWPGSRAAPPAGCVRASLQLARERLARGAHVERACNALRRALAASLITRLPSSQAPPLVLLCDLSPDDDDSLDIALWIGEEDGMDGEGGTSALASAVRVLSELVSRRRLAQHALLGAALRLQAAPAPPLVPTAPPTGASPGIVALAALVPLVLLAAAGGVVLAVRRRRAATAERLRRRDEEKSNNLQNEENLRRYANPLRESPRSAAALYKAPDADARNNTPAHRDKELTKRALPPAPPAPPAHIAHVAPHIHPPPERLTVLV